MVDCSPAECVTRAPIILRNPTFKKGSLALTQRINPNYSRLVMVI